MPEAQPQPSRTALVLGDFSGRNLGHNALLISIVTALREHAGCRSLVPSQDTVRLQRVLACFPDATVVDARPQRLSLKFLGLATWTALRQADCLVLADNPFYDTALFNPLSNGLAAMVWLAGAARRLGLPVICLNAGAGPLRSDTGRRLATALCRRAGLVQARDTESRELLDALNTERVIPVMADSGWSMPWQRIGNGPATAGKRWLGVNLSPEFAHAARADGDEKCAGRQLAGLAAGLVAHAAARGVGVAIVAGHRRDLPLCEGLHEILAARINTRLILASEASWAEVAAQRHSLDCIIGTRYHELLMYASGDVPVLGLDCGEKVPTLMRELGREDCLIPAAALAGESATAMLGEYFATAVARRADMSARAAVLRERAVAGVTALAATLHPNRGLGERNDAVT